MNIITNTKSEVHSGNALLQQPAVLFFLWSKLVMKLKLQSIDGVFINITLFGLVHLLDSTPRSLCVWKHDGLFINMLTF